jgi:hypothetical protein
MALALVKFAEKQLGAPVKGPLPGAPVLWQREQEAVRVWGEIVLWKRIGLFALIQLVGWASAAGWQAACEQLACARFKMAGSLTMPPSN